MKDRYLYRAKRIDNGEWVCGSYVYTFCEDKNRIAVGIKVEKHWIVEENGNMVLVDEDTICQCTGLKDKNGKLIWENDVVRIKYDDVFSEVGWIKYSNCGVRYNFVFGTEIYGIDDSCDIEVIGNIFDNPELMNE